METDDQESSQKNFQNSLDPLSPQNYDAMSAAHENSNMKPSPNLNTDHKAFLVLKEKADNGSIDAQFQIGHYYEDWKNVQQSFELAFHYYKLAANQGHPEAQICLAVLYDNGLGIKQDSEQAFYYYKLSAEQENPEALAQLDKFYEEGKSGVEKLKKEDVLYYKMEIDFESSDSSYLDADKLEVDDKKSEKNAYLEQKSFQFMKEIADKGDSEAQVSVGWCFKTGTGVEKSMESAAHYYQLSADKNSLRGLLSLADCFAQGEGVKKSSEKAIHYYKLAADQGDPYAQFSLAEYLFEKKVNEKQAVHYLKLILNQGKWPHSILLASCEYHLGKCFEKGMGVKKSAKKAFYYYKKSSEHGYHFSQKRLGDAYWEGELGLKKSHEKAIEYYHLAANHGCSFSLKMIGQCYEKGESVEQSLERAFYYYTLAAEKDIKKGYSPSIYVLARCYELGIGAEKSLKNAIHYYKFAAENGLKIGYYKVGCCYKEMGGEENANKADEYFKMAIKENDPDQFKLAKVFEKGFGIETFIEEALNYYHLTADQGDVYAQYFMGNLYEWGKGVEQSKEESFRYYKLSADQGYGPSLIKLGDYYDSEEVKNYKKACEYYKKAADHGCAEAQCDLGFHYRYGLGVDKDISNAIIYYQLAADQGDCRALCNLASCYKDGTGVTAFKYFKKAADLGSSRGQFKVASCYRWGIGVKESLEKAIEYYELALAQDYKKEVTLEKIQECKNVQKNRKTKKERAQTQLAPGAIFYPGTKQLGVLQYFKDRRPEVLRNLFKQASNSAIYVKSLGLNKSEIPIIRDAMIENPRFAFICTEADVKHLKHSFEEIGYHPKSCLGCVKFKYKDKELYRLLFVGEVTD